MAARTDAGLPSGLRRPSLWFALTLPAMLCLGLPAAAGVASEQRGFVSEGVAGRLLFQRCDGAMPAKLQLALNDGTAGKSLLAGIEQVRQVMHQPDRPLYVEFSGELANSLMTVRRFQRAVGHVVDCAGAPAVPPRNVRLLAVGGTPAWRLLATPDGTRLEEPGAKPAQFAALSPAASAADSGARRFTAKPAQGRAAMQIELTEQACADQASESAYGARVIAQLGERRLEGCAVRY